jgi:hypothetical protein
MALGVVDNACLFACACIVAVCVAGYVRIHVLCIDTQYYRVDSNGDTEVTEAAINTRSIKLIQEPHVLAISSLPLAVCSDCRLWLSFESRGFTTTNKVLSCDMSRQMQIRGCSSLVMIHAQSCSSCQLSVPQYRKGAPLSHINSLFQIVIWPSLLYIHIYGSVGGTERHVLAHLMQMLPAFGFSRQTLRPLCQLLPHGTICYHTTDRTYQNKKGATFRVYSIAHPQEHSPADTAVQIGVLQHRQSAC